MGGPAGLVRHRLLGHTLQHLLPLVWLRPKNRISNNAAGCAHSENWLSSRALTAPQNRAHCSRGARLVRLFLPVGGLPLAQQNLQLPSEADGCEGSRTLATLGTERISWEKGPEWSSHPSSTAQLAPPVGAAKGPMWYSSDVTDRTSLHVRSSRSCLLHPRASSDWRSRLHQGGSAEAECPVDLCSRLTT